MTTTLNRTAAWYINGDLPGGLNALLDGVTSNPPSLKPALMQGDVMSLRLYFRKPGAIGAETTAYTLAEGFTLRLVGKLADTIASGAVLFEVTAWTAAESGDYYTGTLDLTAVEINDAFTANTDSDVLNVAVDIEYRDAGNTERVTYRADVQLFRQVYQGGEATPTPSASYPVVSPGGYVWNITVTDEGQLNAERIS